MLQLGHGLILICPTAYRTAHRPPVDILPYLGDTIIPGRYDLPSPGYPLA